jgi:hypothetical protein
VTGRRDERVVLGGRRFERCAFVGCELVVDGRPVHLVENSFEGCVWRLEGAAGVTLDVLAALCRDDSGLRAALAGELGLRGPPARAAAPAPARSRDYH